MKGGQAWLDHYRDFESWSWPVSAPGLTPQ